MSGPLITIERELFGTWGTLYEADVFSILRHSPHTLRAAEFAHVDGALDCSYEYPKGASFTDRYLQLVDRTDFWPSNLLFFDVKSTTSGFAGDQELDATKGQARRAAFFLGICAADPSYIEVIPNLSQCKDSTALGNIDTDRVAINSTRVCRLPPSTYGWLDPCNSPCRMPIRMLPEAMLRIVACFNQGREYVNPWTNVGFPEWQPTSSSSVHWLAPAEDTPHFTSHSAALHVMNCARNLPEAGLEAHFLDVQPRLADFKFCQGSRQVFVQHKWDTSMRSKASRLDNVAIARGSGEDTQWYFSPSDRFDFLMYQFRLSKSGREESMFFFLPEKELPDSFYSSADTSTSFECENFVPFRVGMDDSCMWLHQVASIIRDHPHPRKQGARPSRVLTQTQVSAQRGTHRLVTTISNKSPKGQREYKQSMEHGHARFFYHIMEQCAQRRSGLLLVLSRDHGLGDFGFMRYGWTLSEQQAFLDSGLPPLVIHQLPPDAEMLMILYYTQHAESSYRGPNVRSQQFRRLDSCSESRLVVWDLGGPDTPSEPLMPVVIPSPDIRVTPNQRAIFCDNLSRDKNQGAFYKSTPNLSSVLSTGLFACDYAVKGAYGSLATTPWRTLWSLFLGFTGLHPVEHPIGLQRRPRDYLQTVQAVHQRTNADKS